MSGVPTFKELVDHINSSVVERKANCSVGFFVTEYKKTDDSEPDPGKEVDSFNVKKPAINISSFIHDNEIYFEVSFYFNSYNDSDYKQMWKFLCRHADKVKREAERAEAGDELDRASILSVSIVPEKFRGKYFVYINMPFIDTVSCTENAYDKSVKVSFFCPEEGLSGAVADDDIIDRRSIERQAERELLAEAEQEALH